MSRGNGRVTEADPVGREAARNLARWIQQLVTLARRQWVLDRSPGRKALTTHLARLRALAAVRAAASEQITEEVHAAGDAGATYTEIAEALHMSRQNARKRWPTAVDHPPGPRPRG